MTPTRNQMSSIDYEVYKLLREERAKEGEARRQRALGSYHAAMQLAGQVGWIFNRHSEVHYSLRKPQGNSWILNIYPGNRRLYYDQNKPKGPYLKLNNDWTLVDVVQAAIRQSNATASLTPELSQEKIRERAYFLWEKAGKPDGNGFQYWLQAEKELTNAKFNDNESSCRNDSI